MSALMAAPFSAVNSGLYNYGALSSDFSIYWSSTAYYNTAYYISIADNGIRIEHGLTKSYGIALRCVAKI